MNLIYIHPRCSSCKKALAWLDAQGIDYQTKSLLESSPTESELRTMLDAYAGEVRRLFNTSGNAYRESGLKDRLPAMPQSEAIELLRSDGMLVKRPFILSESGNLVGFREPAWKEKFAPSQP